VLAEIVRLDHAHHRPIAGDSPHAVKLLARTHQTLIWDRSRQVLRLRTAPREFFPAALAALDDLTAPDTLHLLAAAPDPDRAARLSRTDIIAGRNLARRRDAPAKAAHIQDLLRADRLAQPAPVQAAYAAIVTSQVRIITTLNSEIAQLGQVVADHFGRHPDAEAYLRLPGLGIVLSARILARVRRRPRPLRRRQSPQELRRHLTDHPRLRQPTHRPGPLRPQPTPRRRHPPMGLLRPQRITRRPRLLPTTARPWHQPPRRPPPTRQPPRRHPPRLPQNQHHLRRNNRLGTPPRTSHLTNKNMGCLPR
jgi:hypothetical protein